MRFPRLALFVILGLAITGVAGCGGSSTTQPETHAAATPTSTPTTKAPIKIMVQSPDVSQTLSLPEPLYWGKTYAKWINARGGINGHPLEVVTCDNQNDANASIACARQAVSEKVVAVVGPIAYLSDREIPILAPANIAWFGTATPVTAAENTSKVSFPVGSFLPLIGSGVAMGKECKSPALVSPDVPVLQVAAGMVQRGISNVAPGVKLKIVKLPPTAGDYSPQVAETSGSDCVVGNLTPDLWKQWLTAMKGAGLKSRIVAFQGALTQDVINAFPEETNNALIAATYPEITDPSLKQAREIWASGNPPKKYNEGSVVSVGAYIALNLFTNIAAKIDGPITAKTFLDAVSSTKAASSDGILPPIDFANPQGGIPGVTRIFDTNMRFAIVKNGKLDAYGPKWVDLSPLLHGGKVSF